MIHGEGKRKRYIVDGHATHGVSGGPVWHYNAEHDRAEVIGMIVGAPKGFEADDKYAPGGTLPPLAVRAGGWS